MRARARRAGASLRPLGSGGRSEPHVAYEAEWIRAHASVAHTNALHVLLRGVAGWRMARPRTIASIHVWCSRPRLRERPASEERNFAAQKAFAPRDPSTHTSACGAEHCEYASRARTFLPRPFLDPFFPVLPHTTMKYTFQQVGISMYSAGDCSPLVRTCIAFVG